jgi:DNA-binding PadR family transcriptional regulator
MHKNLLLLGLLLGGPKSGYDIHRILRERGALYASLKKANVYYLLDILAKHGFLEVQAEPGARGPRGERLIYSLTDRGRARFDELLHDVLRTPEPVYTSVGAAVAFLDRLTPAEALALLEERQRSIEERRAEAATLVELHKDLPLIEMAFDHLLSLIDADLAWTTRTLERLRAADWDAAPGNARDAQQQPTEAQAR